MIFKDRKTAGDLLVSRLKDFKNALDTIVLGIPRGGVVVAKEVAKRLNLPLDIIITRKIGAPGHEELAVGAVDPDGQTVWQEYLLEELGLHASELHEKVGNEAKEIQRREEAYRKGRKPLDVAGKRVILVDDGVATGETALAAVKYLRRHGATTIILAVPVASKDSLEKLLPFADEKVVLQTPEFFYAVGQFYQNFGEVLDKEVVELLESSDKR